jgi:two-component system, OmpR family, sensor histidine kinase KdpD
LNSDERPDPDTILRVLAEEDTKEKAAKLRVFLGMSAGVGKTYAMLEAAQQKLKEGVDILVGVVETHGRVETAELLKGLPSIPKNKIRYRNTVLEEMDIDTILKRKPQLVVVDELAHTNVPGSRHEKRYQDVLEILDAGIDVFTSLNVQHLESRKDAVEAITGIPIRETVPDSILERASQVELVDISPNELLKRLKEGKVYLGDKAERASQNFFKEDKLTALREIALRMTAERVDQDLQRFISIRKDASPWQINERLLVAVSHSPSSEKLIRATRRLAYNLESPWIALYVDRGNPTSDEEQAQLVKNLNLARELKAEVITTSDTDVSSAIRRIARQKNVTQVVLGRPTISRLPDFIFGGSLLDRVLKDTLDVDVHVIRQEFELKNKIRFFRSFLYLKSSYGPMRFLNAIYLTIVTSLICGLLNKYLGYKPIGFIFLLFILVVGIYGSLSVVIFTAILFALTWNFFFIPPTLSFSFNSMEDLIMYLAFFMVAITTGLLANRIRFHQKITREREDRTNVLYEILKDIANSFEKATFLKKTIARVGNILNAKCGIILKSPEGELNFDDPKDYSFQLNENDRAVAIWSFQNQKPAGWSTDTLSQAKARFIPLKGQTETVGIFVLQPLKKVRKFGLDQEELLNSIMVQLGLSLERHFLTKRLAEAQRVKDSEKLHQTLLNSISHEMRTPLTAILASVSALQDDMVLKEKSSIKNIAENLQEAGTRLNRVIENLLDMTRLNSGIFSLDIQWHDLNDLLGITLKKLALPLSKHKIKLLIQEEIPLVQIDFRLMEHAITNLLMNAAMYTPPGSEIDIKIRKSDNQFIFEIGDNGPGIPEEYIPKIFDKFFRVPGSPTGGTGIGLSLVKNIVELHNGTVVVIPRTPNGIIFRISIPVEPFPEIPPEGEV